MTVPLNLCQSHGNIFEMMCVLSIEWLHHAAKCNNRKSVCAFCRRTDSTTVNSQRANKSFKIFLSLRNTCKASDEDSLKRGPLQ